MFVEARFFESSIVNLLRKLLFKQKTKTLDHLIDTLHRRLKKERKRQKHKQKEKIPKGGMCLIKREREREREIESE